MQRWAFDFIVSKTIMQTNVHVCLEAQLHNVLIPSEFLFN